MKRFKPLSKFLALTIGIMVLIPSQTKTVFARYEEDPNDLIPFIEQEHNFEGLEYGGDETLWTSYSEVSRACSVKFVSASHEKQRTIKIYTSYGTVSTVYVRTFSSDCSNEASWQRTNHNTFFREHYSSMLTYMPVSISYSGTTGSATTLGKVYSNVVAHSSNKFRKTFLDWGVPLNENTCGYGKGPGSGCTKYHSGGNGKSTYPDGSAGEWEDIGYSAAGYLLVNSHFPTNYPFYPSDGAPKNYPIRSTYRYTDTTKYDSAGSGTTEYKIKQDAATRFINKYKLNLTVAQFMARSSLKNDASTEAGIFKVSHATESRYTIFVSDAPSEARYNLALTRLSITDSSDNELGYFSRSKMSSSGTTKTPTRLMGGSQHKLKITIQNDSPAAMNQTVKITYTIGGTTYNKNVTLNCASNSSQTFTLATFTPSKSNTTTSVSAEIVDDTLNLWDVDDAAKINSVPVYYDTAAPSLSISSNNTNWTNGNVTLTATASDSGYNGGPASGINTITLPDGTSKTASSATYTVTANGSYTFKATDKNGNSKSASYTVSNIDKTVPTAKVTLSNESWTNKSVEVTITGEDKGGSNLSKLEYQVNGGSWISVSSGHKFTISNQGQHTVNARATDGAGNVSTTASKTVKIDTTKPAGSISVNTESWQNATQVTVTLGASDTGGSTVASATYTLTGATNSSGTYTNGTQITISTQGETKIAVQVTDKAGNKSDTVTKWVRIDRTNPTGSISFNHENWQNASSVSVKLAAGDSHSGVQTATYTLTGATQSSGTYTKDGKTITVSNQGATTVKITVTDNVGRTYTTSKVVRIDQTSPTLTTSQNPASFTNTDVVVTAKATDNIGIWSLNAYKSQIGRYNYFSAAQTKSSGKILIVMNDTAYDSTSDVNYPGHLNNFAAQLRTLGFTVTTMRESAFTSISQTTGYNAILYLGWAWHPNDNTYSILNTAYNNGIHLFTSGNDCSERLDLIQSSVQMSGNQTVSKSSNNHLGELVHNANGHDQGYKKITPISGVKTLAKVTHEDGTSSPYLIQYTNSNSTQWIHQQGTHEGTRLEFVSSVALLLLQRNSTLTTTFTHNFTVTENGTYPVTVYDLAGNRTTLNHVVNTIDRHNPTGSVVIDKGQDFLNNEETTLHIKFNDVVSGNNVASGVHTIKVSDVNGTYSHTITNPTGTSMSIPWVLVPWEAADGALKTQVRVDITDRAGNKITVYSQVVDIIKVYVTDFYLTNVLNPLVYNQTNPFTTLKYPQIPAQDLLAGGHFTYRFDYYHPKNVNSKWKIDFIEYVRYQKPNGVEEVYPTNRLKQQVESEFTSQVVIPYTIPAGTKVWLDIKLVLYDQNGRKVAEGYFPQPENTSLLIGTIQDDLRNVLIFNEFN